MWQRGCFPTKTLAWPRRLYRMRDRCAVLRTLLQCVCTQRRNCIGQLSPFSEYAPTALRNKWKPAATIKLIHYRRWVRSPMNHPPVADILAMPSEDTCHLPPRADLMPRSLSTSAIDAKLVVPAARIARAADAGFSLVRQQPVPANQGRLPRRGCAGCSHQAAGGLHHQASG